MKDEEEDERERRRVPVEMGHTLSVLAPPPEPRDYFSVDVRTPEQIVYVGGRAYRVTSKDLGDGTYEITATTL
jgi:hypothetical protein